MESSLNGCFIIPTGIAAFIGGDTAATAAMKVIGACCNNLIVNPNACNSSDLNFMPPNALYVEGSIIDRFLEGSIKLKSSKTFNKILCVANPPLQPDNHNAVNAAIYTMGADIELLELKTPLIMKACFNEDGTAGGVFSGADELVEQVKYLDFDFLTIHTPIDIDEEIAKAYWEGKIKVNPWGGIESIVSRYISLRLNKNLAHSPICEKNDFELRLHHTNIVKPSMAAEAISNTYATCMFIGGHRAPIISDEGLSNKDIDFLITPHGCFGRPHEACIKNNIPIIVVKENTTIFSKGFVYPKYNKLIMVDNYLESAGVLMSWISGVDHRKVVLNPDKFSIL